MLTKIIGPFTQVLTMETLPVNGPLKDSQLPILKNAGLQIKGQRIEKVADFDKLVKEADTAAVEIMEINQPMVVLPGFIDCHTHICFGGKRAQDYALRNSGATYLEIAKAGGGIWDTVQQTRLTDLPTLADLTAQRAQRHLLEGVTTLEVKSGYGLNLEAELKMLRAITRAQKDTAATLVPTCLAAHMLPKDFDGSHKEYLDWIIHSLIPEIKDEHLTNRIDIFIEESAFSTQDGLQFLGAVKSLGFDITVHGDQFTAGGSKVAVDVGAVSVDHLEVCGDAEIAYLAQSDTVATALPGASMGLGCAFTPARKLLDAGACVAIASDWNPGSAPMGDLLMQACVLGSYEKLSNAEVLAGLTYRAAHALRMEDRGVLSPGFEADFIGFETDNYQDILWHQGKMKPHMVWKSGKLV